MKKYRYAGRELEGIEIPHEMMSEGRCTWCNEAGKKTKTAILSISLRICSDCLKKLEVEQ